MPFTEQEFQQEVTGLESEISIAKRSAEDFSKRHFNGVRENAIIFCLERASDIAEGCLIVANAKLPASLGSLNRALLEILFWACWVVQSDENAQAYQGLAVNELKRLMRKNLGTGHARVVHKETQEDKLLEFLKSPEMANVPKRLRIEDVARLAGLERIYTQIYGLMSMDAHGNTFGMSSFLATDVDQKMFMLIASANALLACVNLIAKNWIVNLRQTDIADVYRILNI